MNDKDPVFSAFVDDELSNAERNEQIDQISKDVNLQYRLKRYQLIGDLMRQEVASQVDLDFSARVMRQIHSIEATGSKQFASADNRQAVGKANWLAGWFKPLSGLAVAASVAYVAVIGLQNTLITNDSDSKIPAVATQLNEEQRLISQQVERLVQMPMTSSIRQVSAPALQLSGDRLQWQVNQHQKGLQTKLNSYLVNHTEYSNPMHGIIPHARVVGFDTDR
jgi:sigma-E factor negative regulatory protein RseA